jgi:hypothetical protein
MSIFCPFLCYKILLDRVAHAPKHVCFSRPDYDANILLGLPAINPLKTGFFSTGKRGEVFVFSVQIKFVTIAHLLFYNSYFAACSNEYTLSP